MKKNKNPKPATNKQKIRAVKRHVAELQSLIDTIKGEELSEQAKKHDYAVMDEIATNNNSKSNVAQVSHV